MGPRDEEDSDHEPGHAALELVRVIDRTDFVSPTDFDREKEFVVRNDTEKEKNYILLPLGDFRINLEVYDEDKSKLNYFPNDEVEGLLESVKQENKEAYNQIQNRFGEDNYKLFVQLPPDNPIGPGELRTIRITFGQSEQPKYHRIWEKPRIVGWITHWKRKLFRIPSFIARANRKPNRSHSEFFVVEGPPEYVTVADKSEAHSDRDQFYENGYGTDTRVLSTHLPPAKEEGYTWNLSYDLIPNNIGLLQVLGGYWFITIAVAFAILSIQLGIKSGVIGAQQLSIMGFSKGLAGRSISTGIISVTAGLIYALRAEWAERYRIMSLVPILLHGISWLFWALLRSNGG